MPCGGPSVGIQRLIDANQRYFTPGLPVSYRLRNFDLTNTDAGEMGFIYTPAVTGVAMGTQDILMCPQPTVQMMNMRMIEAAMASGSALRFGARKLIVSNTWVAQMQAQRGFATPEQVFKDKSVVGFVTSDFLMEVVSYTHLDVYGATLQWTLLCNANDIR